MKETKLVLAISVVFVCLCVCVCVYAVILIDLMYGYNITLFFIMHHGFSCFLACPANCIACDENSCTTCKAGYVWENDACVGK